MSLIACFKFLSALKCQTVGLDDHQMTIVGNFQLKSSFMFCAVLQLMGERRKDNSSFDPDGSIVGTIFFPLLHFSREKLILPAWE